MSLWSTGIKPLTSVASSKLLKLMRRSTYILACPIATALGSDINQTVLIRVCEKTDGFHSSVLRSGQSTNARYGELGEFVSESSSWELWFPFDVKWLCRPTQANMEQRTSSAK